MPPVFDLDQTRKEAFGTGLLDWFAANMRPLPWRETYDPYSVWVSEIMLQQTQMERGVAYFNAWMQIFPTIASVAEADEDAVLKAWEGLGYYSRARNLHKAAKLIMEDFGGEFPQTLADIRSLPGVGEYTAGAIAAIAFNQPEVAVDANVMRIFARICDIDVPLTHLGVKRFIAKAVQSLVPVASPRLFAQALMELGALVCSQKPSCPSCPLIDYCEAHRLGVVEKRPKKKQPVAYSNLVMSTGIIMKDGRLFIQKRPPYGVWAGLWEFPGGCLEEGESPEEALVREVAEETELPVSIRDKMAVVNHSYTTCRVTMHAFSCDLLDADKQPVLHAAVAGRWILPEEIVDYAFPAGHRKLLDRLGWGK